MKPIRMTFIIDYGFNGEYELLRAHYKIIKVPMDGRLVSAPIDLFNPLISQCTTLQPPTDTGDKILNNR